MTATSAILPGEAGALRRGACPSIAAPMRTGDGLLVRLRPVATALTAQDLLALADLARAHGNGLIEITARGNLQLRGLTEASVPHLAAGLAAAGITPQTGVAIEVPPLAGIDPAELADAAPLADALRAALADAALAPKLAIVVDGGGVLSLADMVADIRLDAVAGAQGLAWRLSVGGDRATAMAVALLPGERAVEGVMTVAAALAATGPAARGRDLDPALLAAALRADPVPPLSAASPVHPLGAHRIGAETVLGLAPAYGQIHADRLAALVRALAGCGATEFRLAPHHTLLVRGLRAEALAAAQACAMRERVWSTQDAPGRAVSVCAGAAGCAAASFDTHAVADALVAEAGDLLDGSFDVHVSGCPKGCAHPAAAAVTLCGTAAGVGLILDGRAGDAAAAILPADALRPALTRLGALLRARRAEGETAGNLIDRTTPALLASAYQGQQ
ncbi:MULTISPECIES: precorrin-3B synthase [unclassified Shinella]|uniref:precorrin-3B synthase n=1 Tax=unclassified Shinella TaxID=2643062 RepID=UPI00225C8979|nr:MULTISPECIES: precorrin-3B synthase [unclassified Shinella]MCO5140920.1 precorrin-3B synthase [Shinella sp.]CAI0340051.1 Precorrin-3B synthase [Rhizobiaceae bacterium]CAK7258440.1 Precorrin-3B synthase [Shinella sp. WSC3-e]